MKLWRVSGDRVEATAAIIRRGEQFTAAVHYQYADGRTRSWRWRARDGSYLSGREIVRCMNSIDRGFRSIPGVHVRIDFPQDASREEQMVILMDYGLTAPLHGRGISRRLAISPTSSELDLPRPGPRAFATDPPLEAVAKRRCPG